MQSASDTEIQHPAQKRPGLSSRARKYLARTLLALFLGFFSLKAVENPSYGWDAIAYVGATLSPEISDAKLLHQESYAHIRAAVSEEKYRELTRGNYRGAVAKDPEAFGSQLSFYRVKPLYVFLLQASRKLGLNPLEGMALVNILSVLLCSIAISFWFERYVPPFSALGLTLALYYAARMYELSRIATPDALSTVLLVLGAYALLEKRWALRGMLLMSAAVLARSNNVIFTSMLSGSLLWIAAQAADTRVGLNRRSCAALLLPHTLPLLAYGYIALQQSHSWWALFHHSFVSYLVDLDQFDLSFDSQTYFAVLREQGAKLIFESPTALNNLPIFSLIAILVMLFSLKQRRPEALHMGVLFFANALVYLLMFPLLPAFDRLLAAQYILIALMLCATLADRRGLEPSQKQVA